MSEEFVSIPMDLVRKRIDVEVAYDYRKWVEKIPDLNFPSDWTIRPIPPFGGALVRFLIKRPDTREGHRVSVYLDCYAELGATYKPYWEIYPGTNEGDTERVYLDETTELMESIDIGLDFLVDTPEDW